MNECCGAGLTSMHYNAAETFPEAFTPRLSIWHFAGGRGA